MVVNKLTKISKKLKRRDTIILILILILACILSIYHHISYPYPFHVDEWYHIARAKQIAFGSSIDWYFGTNFTIGIELAWHYMLAIIYFIFRPDIQQWIFFPSIVHFFSIITSYVFILKLLGKKEALVTSLLVALLPTNNTMGGPVFLAPINLSLVFIPLGLLFGFNLLKIKKYFNYIFLFLILLFLLYSHPPSAIPLLLILSFYFIFNLFSKDTYLKNDAKYLFITIISAIICSIPNFLSEFLTRNLESITFNFWIQLQGIVLLYGIIPSLIFVLGFYLLSKQFDRRIWAILLTSIVLILNIIFFDYSGVSYLLPYQRTHIPLFLVISFIGSYGYVELMKLKKPKNIGFLIFIVVIIGTIAISIPRNLETEYYHIIDDNDYDSFLWIKENTASDIVVLSDPWKARALAPVAERRVYAVMPFGPNVEQMNLVFNANAFLNTNCTNTSFLIDNHIDIVYTTQPCNNANLTEVYLNTYLFKQE